MSSDAVRGSLADDRLECRCGNNGAAPILLNLRDAARALAISSRSLWEWTKAGKVPHVRLGRRVLFAPEDLRRWAQSHRHGPGAPDGAGEPPENLSTGT